MSLIHVNDLTFRYDTHGDTVFDHVTFQMDTSWKLGLIGRNGRGKTTLLRLLLGDYEYSGNITTPVGFDYFPFPVAEEGDTLTTVKNMVAPFTEWEEEMERLLADGSPQAMSRYLRVLDRYSEAEGYTIEQTLAVEASKLGVGKDVFERPFSTLSNGERTKLMLAALFQRKNRFLLIDEPTNHLDQEGRDAIGSYLSGKRGFLLVSHDRDLLDQCVDHILSLNRAGIELQHGNYSSWQLNRDRQDQFELARNEHLKKEIHRLNDAARAAAVWSNKTEKTKKGLGQGSPSGLRPDRGAVGHKAAKLMKRAKSIEQRREQAAEETTKLLKNLEQAEPLKLHPLPFPKAKLASLHGLSICYSGQEVFAPVSFDIRSGDRIALEDPNGSGKSSIIKLLCGREVPHHGTISTGSGLVISYVPQDTASLQGSFTQLAQENGVEESLFKAVLRKLDFSRAQFEKDLSELSEGQKKKVLLAAGICRPAHLYLWDEPLNFIDILSRVQIERLILSFQPTLLFVEHDSRFRDNIATKRIRLSPPGKGR